MDGPERGSDLEVVMHVKPAPRVERSAAAWATDDVQVCPNRQLLTADPAEDRRGPLLLHRPGGGVVVCVLLVALVARVVLEATVKLDSDDVERCAVVDTPSLLIDQTP